MQWPDAVAAILADWQAATPAERRIARPIYLERLRATGAEDPETMLGSDEPENDPHEESAPPRRSQATQLVQLAGPLELWHTADSEPHCDVSVDGHRETHALRSRAVRDYLTRAYYVTYGTAARGESLKEALAVLEARARWDGPQHLVGLRVAEHDGAIYLDLGDPTWRAVRVSADGWEVVAEPPVRLRRTGGMLPLPEPVHGGTLVAMRELLHVESDDDWCQLVGWMLAAFRPRGPYPVLALDGEQGSSKSTTARMLRSLVDPNVAALRSEPHDARDLIIAARNAHVVALDNVSRLQPWLSDALCRLSTGGGYSTREYFTTLDEVVVDVQRPVILTGIEDVCARADLADRALAVTLPAMPESARRPERELWAAFERTRPGVLGALLDAVACGIRELPSIQLDSLPRMADYAEWLSACEPVLRVKPGAMLKAYVTARRTAAASTLEASAVAAALRDWAPTAGSSEWTWEGTATSLLVALAEHAPESVCRDPRRWPQSPRSLSGALRRLAPALRGAGIVIDLDRRATDRSRCRLIRVTIGREGGAIVHTVHTVQEGEHASADAGGAEGREGRRQRGPRPEGRASDGSAPRRGGSDGTDGSDGGAPAKDDRSAGPPDEVSV